MKKTLALLLACLMVAALFAGCAPSEETPSGSNNTNDPAYKVAMVTDYGDITDQSFNQTTWEACVKFCNENNVPVKYYKPTGDSTAERVASVDLAVAEGYNVIVMPGFAFAGTIAEISGEYKDVKFIALDVAEGDLLAEGVALAGESYDYNPSNWNLTDYVYMDNVYCAIYQEELSGYMAGYAAVKLGYTKLGFLGGMAVPAVMRFGYGFVQGADAAAKELNVDVEMKYAYGNQFFGDADITARMDTWYQGGTQVVFACGGGIYTSAVDAAKKVTGTKVIGVDVDQSGVITAYAAGEDATAEDLAKWSNLTVTSAMKGLAPTTIDTLADIILNGKWSEYAGKIVTLGLVSGDDPSLNYVQIPTTTQFEDGKFTEADYKALVKGMFDGTIKVSNDISAAEPTAEKVVITFEGNIK